jgi:hypothetical protein
MPDPELHPKISATDLPTEGQELVSEWNQRVYDNPELAAQVLHNMVETPANLSMDDEDAIYFHFLTGSVLEATGNGRQLDFPNDEIFETERHNRLLRELNKARGSGDAEAKDKALRLLNLDLLSHHVQIVTDYKSQQNPPSVA